MAAAMASARRSHRVEIWEWQRDDEGYSPYPAEVIRALNEAFHSRAGRYDLMLMPTSCKERHPTLVEYVVDFSAMEQVHKSSGYRRNVRRRTVSVPDTTACEGEWMWNMGHGQFVLYDIPAMMEIEGAYQCRHSRGNCIDLSQTSANIPYTVSFASQNGYMTQIRHGYNTQRQVQRFIMPQPLQIYIQSPYKGKAPSCMQEDGTTSLASSLRQPAIFPKTEPQIDLYRGGLPSTSYGNPPSTGYGNSPSTSYENSPFTGYRNPPSTSYGNPPSTGYRNPPSTGYGNSPFTGYGNSPFTGYGNPPSTSYGNPPSTSYGNPPSTGYRNSPSTSYGNRTASQGGHTVINLDNSDEEESDWRCNGQSGLSTHVKGKSLFGRRHNVQHKEGKDSTVVKVTTSLPPLEPRMAKYVIWVPTLTKEEDGPCPICLCQLSEGSDYNPLAGGEGQNIVKMKKCPHMLHHICFSQYLKNANDSAAGIPCPTCKKIHGVKIGDMPKEYGGMNVRTSSYSLPGHPGVGTIEITYSFSSGFDNKSGRRFHAAGFPRNCYLPNCPKGQKVLRLLKRAWERRLTFTIGTSVTTGQPNTVVWNEIHHKTENRGNYTGHGYPDPNYLDNVLGELQSQGVTDDQSDDTDEDL